MRLLSRRLGLALCLSLCAAPLACSNSATTGTPRPLPHARADSAAIRFDDGSTPTLALSPGAAQVLHVIATPPMPYDVRFALVGDALDGSLDSAVVQSGDDGRAMVTLRAPSHSTTFHVRASMLDSNGVPGASAERAVAVSEQGFGSVRVAPMYLGHRPVTDWTASVVALASCGGLVGTLPDEPLGALSATAPSGGEPVIDNAPVGPHLAVAVRAGHFAWGCADTTALTPGSTIEVPVTVIDKPIDLKAGSLAVVFGYSPDPGAYTAFLAGAVAALGEAFMPTGSPEGTVVLNSMAALTPPAVAAAFTQHRVDQSWDALANQHFAALGTGLRQACDTWATAGTALQGTSFQATVSAGPAPGQAALAVTKFGSLDAGAAGVTTAPGATWSAQPADTVLLGATLLWEPSRFAAAASLGPAQKAHPGAATVAAALAAQADCYGLAMTLGSFASCSVDCVEQLCSAALGARWVSALGASKQTSSLGKVVIQASASASVGDVAEPTALDGHWLGKIGVGAVELQLKGDLKGTAAAPPAQ